MDVSQSQRDRIITLHTDAHFTQRKIACQLGLSQPTVHRIIKRYTDICVSTTLRSGKCGRKRKSSALENRRILRCSMINPRLSANDIKKELDSDLSVATIKRRLAEGGRFARKPVHKPLLTMKAKKLRLQWARQHRHWTVRDWEKVIFSDETSVEVQLAQPRFVRKEPEPISPKHMVMHIKQPQKVMFWGCMSIYGVGRLHVVQGIMKAVDYNNVLQTRLQPKQQSGSHRGILFNKITPPSTQPGW